MARLARVVVPDHPHRVTQRGNGRARTLFDDSDNAVYRDLLAANCRAAGVEVWAPLRALAGRSETMTFSPASSD
jgi:putative transposase